MLGVVFVNTGEIRRISFIIKTNLLMFRGEEYVTETRLWFDGVEVEIPGAHMEVVINFGEKTETCE